MTRPGRTLSNTRRTSAPRVRSNSALRGTNTVPSRRRSSSVTTWRPRKPAPPVTRMRRCVGCMLLLAPADHGGNARRRHGLRNPPMIGGVGVIVVREPLVRDSREVDDRNLLVRQAVNEVGWIPALVLQQQERKWHPAIGARAIHLRDQRPVHLQLALDDLRRDR